VFAAPPEPHPYRTVTQTEWPLGRPHVRAPAAPRSPEPAGPAWYDERFEAPPPEEPGYGHGV
jgi:hypothetical protein